MKNTDHSMKVDTVSVPASAKGAMTLASNEFVATNLL